MHVYFCPCLFYVCCTNVTIFCCLYCKWMILCVTEYFYIIQFLSTSVLHFWCLKPLAWRQIVKCPARHVTASLLLSAGLLKVYLSLLEVYWTYTECVAAQHGLTSENKHAPRQHPLTTTNNNRGSHVALVLSVPVPPGSAHSCCCYPQTTVSSLQPPCCVHVQLAL